MSKKTLLYNLDSLLNYAELTKDLDPSFVMKPELEIQEEFSMAEELEHEMQVFGFYFTHHPTTIYESKYLDCIKLEEVPKYFNKKISTLVLVDRIKVINTKKGDKMAFVTASDETQSMSYTLFPKVYQLYATLNRLDIVKITGMVEKRLNEYQIIVDKIEWVEGEGNNEETSHL